MKRLYILYIFLLLISFKTDAQWVQLPQEIPNMRSIYFIDTNTGYVATYNSNDELPKLFKTTNGGLNWSEILLPNVGNYTKITTMRFFDNDVGFLTTDDPLTSLRTTDSGESWQQLQCGDEQYPGKAYFKNDGTGYYFSGVIDENLFYTDDWGATWSPNSIDSFHYINDIQFLNDEGNIGYMHTEWGTYKTTDNGINWEEILYIENTGHVFFYNENIGYVGGYFGLYRTLDGGDNWDYNSVFNNTKTYFISENIGFKISSFFTPPITIPSRVYKTLDSGETWQEMQRDNDTEIMENTLDFCFPSNTTGYAIRSNYIYKLDVAASVATINENKIAIYPVPATNLLNINNFETLQNSNYQIVDLTGKTIMEGTITDRTININELAKGIYLLKIGERKPIKFIKE